MIAGADAPITEESRMASPHFFFEGVGDDLGIELRSLFADDDLKREMQQHVAQLVAHRFGVVGLNGLIELECFLDQIRTECLGSLCAVPGTALPQFAHKSESTSKR